jgi:hypothetical protein
VACQAQVGLNLLLMGGRHFFRCNFLTKGPICFKNVLHLHQTGKRMKIQIISWDQETVDHIANHSVLPEEVEQALFNDYDMPVILRGKENKYLTYGETDSGRLLFVVWISRNRKTRIVTARDMTKKEKQFYRKRKK